MTTQRTAALAALALLALPIAACSDDEEKAGAGSSVDPRCAELEAGEVAPPSTYADYTTGSFAIQYDLSDGSSECVVMDRAIASGSFEVAGKSMQVYVDLGDVDLGVTVDMASFSEEGDQPFGTGTVPGAGLGLQIEQHFYSPAEPAGCTVALAELTADTFTGSFSCADMPGTTKGAGPFGGEPTDGTVVSATGWWKAATG